MFCLRRFAQSIDLFACECLDLMFSQSSSLYIEVLTDVENLAVTSTCLALKIWFFTLDLLPDLIVVLWKEQRLQQSYCYPCLDVETKIAEMVVAELVVVHFVHYPLSTLVKLLLARYASDDHCFWWPCFWWRVSRSSSSDSFIQMHFFRRISSDAFFQTL